TIGEFQPLAIVALAWVALVIGLDYGYVGDRRIGVRGLALGIGMALLCFCGVGAVAFSYLRGFTQLPIGDALFEAAVVATVSCETTRQAVRWVSERYAASGPLARTFADIADGEDLVPVLALASLVALTPRAEASVNLPALGWL